MAEPDSLLSIFTQNAQSAGASVELIKRSPEALSDSLNKLTEDFDEVIYIRPTSLPHEFFSDFLNNDKVISSPVKKQLGDAKVAITDTFAGIARTGSVCLELTDSYTNHASLLSTWHIAVLDAQKIVPQPRDIFKEGLVLKKGNPLDFVIITGPSATADMGKLVRGAHGPAKLHIIILT